MVEVVLEMGPKKKVFATAVRWPGWCRSGRDEQSALAASAGHASRYAPVAARAGLAVPEITGADEFVVVERVAGDGATDFGVPGTVTGWDTTPLPGDEALRRVDLVGAAWALFRVARSRSRVGDRRQEPALAARRHSRRSRTPGPRGHGRRRRCRQSGAVG